MLPDNTRFVAVAVAVVVVATLMFTRLVFSGAPSSLLGN